MWNVTHDSWHVTRGMWQVTRDMWHMTHDMYGGGGDLWYYEDLDESNLFTVNGKKMDLDILNQWQVWPLFV